MNKKTSALKLPLKVIFGLFSLGVWSIGVWQPSFAQEQAVGSEEIFYLQLNKEAREQLIKKSIHKIQNSVAYALQNAQIDQLSLSPNADDCTPEKIAQMDRKEAWKKCPGLPDYLFKDGSWIPNFHPRAVQVNIKNFKVDQFTFGEPQIVCEDKLCDITFFLPHLSLSTEVNFKTVHGSKSFPAGSEIFNIPQAKLVIGKNHQENQQTDKENLPYVKVRFNLGSKKYNDGIIEFDYFSTKIHIPSESLKLQTSNNLQDLSLLNLINSSPLLTLKSSSASVILGFASTMSSKLSNINNIINVNESLCHHLQDSGKFGCLDQMINDKLPNLLDQWNKKIKSLDLFSANGKAVSDGKDLLFGDYGLINDEAKNFYFRLTHQEQSCKLSSDSSNESTDQAFHPNQGISSLGDILIKLNLKYIEEKIKTIFQNNPSLSQFNINDQSFQLAEIPNISWNQDEKALSLNLILNLSPQNKSIALQGSIKMVPCSSKTDDCLDISFQVKNESELDEKSLQAAKNSLRYLGQKVKERIMEKLQATPFYKIAKTVDRLDVKSSDIPGEFKKRISLDQVKLDCQHCDEKGPADTKNNKIEMKLKF